MSFDSSRFTFDPWQNFSGVIMSQGRVQLDSDWNEWLAEFNRRIQAGTLDIVGQAGVPSSTPNGFAIALTSVSGNASVSIGPGRMYVDGILAENHGSPVPNPEKWTPEADAVPEAQYPDWDTSLAELRGDNPVDYNSQPYYPNPVGFPQSGGPYLVYLDVWQREVTFLEDPDLVEKAVGVDTTGRLQTVWQVKWLDVSAISGVTCTSDIPAWDAMLLPPGARLTTGVVQMNPSGPCCLTSNSGYTGLENQLYRLEIHQPGAAATFKWSRDNASVATGVTGIDASGMILTVQSTGRDSVLRFSPNDWVEITDDWLELNGLCGEIHQVSFVSDSAKTVTLTSALAAGKFPVDANNQTTPSRHTRLTRWDQEGQILESDGVTVWADLTLPGSTGDIPVPPPGTTLILENGITVSFNSISSGSPFTSAQAWNFAARTADGTVEYLDNAPPRCIYHHYARLALTTVPGTPTSCRIVFPPLTGLQESGCSCCSVTVGDGVSSHGDFTDIQQAINSLTGSTVAEVCLLAGTYSPAATVNIASSNLIIKGCAQAYVQFAGAGPAFQVTSASQITFDSLNVQASSTAVEITLGTQISIVNCTFTISGSNLASNAGSFAVVAQATGLVVSGSQLSGGGIWILDGSSQIEIADNVITNAQGSGIGLGGLPGNISPDPNATGVINVTIESNQITGASDSGISTVFGTLLAGGQGENAPALGDVEDLVIEGNVISNCADTGAGSPVSVALVAGILLEDSVNVTIRENTISNNGNANNIATCGVYVKDVSNLEISENQIVDNGATAAAGTTGVGLQAGIYGRVARYGPTDSVRIRENLVRVPAGPALQLEAIGPVSITGNVLQSFGVWRDDQSGLAVYIANLGLPLELGEVSLAPLERATVQMSATGLTTTPDVALMDGRTAFDGNQVTFVPDPPPSGDVVPCVLLTLDDLSLQNNQFETTIINPNSAIFIHVMAFGFFTLRSMGNRFSEFPDTAFLSHLGMGLYNIVNLNQATHCVDAIGTNTMTGTTNQVIITTACNDAGNLRGALTGGE